MFCTGRDKILPPKLLREVQKHHTGMIYVSSDGAFYRERNVEVMRLHGQGLPTAEIARRVYIGPRRVQQVIKAETEKTGRRAAVRQAHGGVPSVSRGAAS